MQTVNYIDGYRKYMEKGTEVEAAVVFDFFFHHSIIVKIRLLFTYNYKGLKHIYNYHKIKK